MKYQITDIEKQYNEILYDRWKNQKEEFLNFKDFMWRMKTFIFSHNQMMALLEKFDYENPVKDAKKMEKNLCLDFNREDAFRESVSHTKPCKKCGKVPRVERRNDIFNETKDIKYRFSCCDKKTAFYADIKEASKKWNKYYGRE